MQGPVRVDLLWQRQLHEDAVNLRIRVEAFEQRHQLGFAGVFGKLDGLMIQTGFVARFSLHADVHLRCRVVADEYHRQSRRDALLLERRDLRSQLRTHCGADRVPVDQLSGQRRPPVFRGSPRL